MLGTDSREGNIFGANKLDTYQLRYTYIADLMRLDLGGLPALHLTS